MTIKNMQLCNKVYKSERWVMLMSGPLQKLETLPIGTEFILVIQKQAVQIAQ